MAFTLVATASGLSAIAPDGTKTTLTLPSGVTAVAGARLRGAVLNRLALLANGFSAPIWVAPSMTVYPAQIAPPAIAPTLADGGGTGYTGTVRGRVQFLIKDEFGNILGSSELSPVSGALTIANKQITWTVPTSPNPAVNARRLYRTATSGTSYFWDADIDDNTTTSYTNSTADASLATDAVDATAYVTCPSALDLVAEYKGRAWARSKVDPDTLYGSALDDVTNWPVSIPTYPIGAERSGLTGFAPRRDDLVLLKRAIILKLVGDSEDNFRVLRVTEGQGCVSPDTVKVIRDVAYWLDSDGVWMLGPEDKPISLTDDTVRPWFTTDTYFNRAQFGNAFAEYDPRKHSYDLFLCSAGSTTIDRWVSLDILSNKWFGPHKTAAFTPACAAVASDTGGNLRQVVGGSDGYLYAPVPGNYSDLSTTAIDFDVYTKFHSGDAPDYMHAWLQPTVFTKKESAGTLTITPYVGDTDASAGTAISHDLTLERERLSRLGAGRLVQLRLRQATAAQGVEIYGYQLPYVTLGRR